jgi:hypothetical protein
MNRYCIRHSHRGSSRAYRLILARHSLDRDAEQLVVDEHRDCPACLTDTVQALADACHGLLIRAGPLPSMDSAGVAFGPAIDELLERVDAALEAEELDRRELEK